MGTLHLACWMPCVTGMLPMVSGKLGKAGLGYFFYMLLCGGLQAGCNDIKSMGVSKVMYLAVLFCVVKASSVVVATSFSIFNLRNQSQSDAAHEIRIGGLVEALKM